MSVEMINQKDIEEDNKSTAPFLSNCDAQAHNFSEPNDIGITYKSSPAKRQLSKLCRKTHTPCHYLPLTTQLEIRG
jgi:hypothetical protein